jgi:ATP-dependent Clp protease ATP-binding subunit ClpA
MIFYNNVILILTSNITKEAIDKMDEAYLRKGRVTEYYSMLNKINIP